MDDDGVLREGIVITAGAGHCHVAFDDRVWLCRVRGRLKKGPREEQTIAVAGDRVLVLPVAGTGTDGMVEKVLPRRNRISRLAARRSGGRVEQVLMANLDLLVAVQSVREPAPQSGFVDRLLAAAVRFGVAGALVLNKIDLLDSAGEQRERDKWGYYTSLGCSVVPASVTDGRGLDDVRSLLAGRISLFLGASGVGKSSLLNALQPGLGLRVAEVTGRTGLGRHTTTHTQLHQVPGGGYIADSPGLRGFDPWDVAPVDVRAYFPDLEAAGANCRFRSCLHRDEPNCGVKDAMARGVIPAWRHEAYLGLLRDLEDRARGAGYRD